MKLWNGTLAAALMMASSLAGTAHAAGTDPHGGKFTISEATHGLTGSGKLTAVIDTTMGTFHCELFEQDAPNTVANFVGLARGLRSFRDPLNNNWVKRPYYDGLIFHRVIPGFMIQGGDLTGTGSGQIGYEILDEKNAPHKFDKGGVLAMANRGPNTASAQFFITEKETSPLDDGGRAGGHYQIFGQCDEVELVKKIAATPRNPMDRPLQEVKMTKVTIKRDSGAAPAGGDAAPAGGKTPAKSKAGVPKKAAAKASSKG